jgi:hypothetical protein
MHARCFRSRGKTDKFNPLYILFSVGLQDRIRIPILTCLRKLMSYIYWEKSMFCNFLLHEPVMKKIFQLIKMPWQSYRKIYAGQDQDLDPEPDTYKKSDPDPVKNRTQHWFPVQQIRNRILF